MVRPVQQVCWWHKCAAVPTVVHRREHACTFLSERVSHIIAHQNLGCHRKLVEIFRGDVAHVLKRGQCQKRGESKRKRLERSGPNQRAPDSKKLAQTTHERNQAELPMRLGVGSKEKGRSRTQSLARHRATLARTPEGTRASSESSEPVTCAERCRRCWVWVSCGVQFNADRSRCRKGIDITHIDVGALSS